MATIVFFALMAWVAFDLLCGPEAVWRSRKAILAHVQKQNDRRGITMRPGWLYKWPDGSRHRSRTGRSRDCICGGKHPSHARVDADAKAACRGPKRRKRRLRHAPGEVT